MRMMFEKRTNIWDECAKSGIIVPLVKKGDRSNGKNYRCLCLLSGKAERLGLLDDNQTGFRSDRSTADVVQMIIREQEDVNHSMTV